jgi:hypothetical protein
MVKRRRALAVLPVLLLLTLFAASVCMQIGSAQEIQYHLEKQWAKIWINTDGTIDLQYTIRIVCDQGRIRYVTFDQPVGDFKLGEAIDDTGHALTFEDATQGSDYKARVYLYEPITDGQSAEFTATTNVGHMIWKDEMNPGNIGLQFIPTSWSVGISDLRVLVVLPAGVSQDQIKVTPDWDNAFTDPNEGGRLVVYWERKDAAPSTKFQVGVSFPETAVEHYETTKRTNIVSGNIGIISGLLVVIVIAIIVVAVRKARRAYLAPKMQMETLGIRRGFTAVEAAHLLGLPPAKLVVMMLYSLLLKHAVWVKSTQPSLGLQISEEFKDPTRAAQTPLRYYEKDFLRAIKSDGRLDEKILAEAFMQVRTAVENSMTGYCRADTIAFYKKTVDEAWGQVEKAGAADVASKIFDEKLLWLMLDENFKGRSENAFKGFDFQPMLFWWWYWYGYSQYNPNPVYDPVKDAGHPPPTIPGAEFANNIANSIEMTANNFVMNLEKFANSILPAPPPKQLSRQPVHHEANCACACVSCACVCACVSCACACASGGGVG